MFTKTIKHDVLSLIIQDGEDEKMDYTHIAFLKEIGRCSMEDKISEFEYELGTTDINKDVLIENFRKTLTNTDTDYIRVKNGDECPCCNNKSLLKFFTIEDYESSYSGSSEIKIPIFKHTLTKCPICDFTITKFFKDIDNYTSEILSNLWDDKVIYY